MIFIQMSELYVIFVTFISGDGRREKKEDILIDSNATMHQFYMKVYNTAKEIGMRDPDLRIMLNQKGEPYVPPFKSTIKISEYYEVLKTGSPDIFYVMDKDNTFSFRSRPGSLLTPVKVQQVEAIEIKLETPIIFEGRRTTLGFILNEAYNMGLSHGDE